MPNQKEVIQNVQNLSTIPNAMQALTLNAGSEVRMTKLLMYPTKGKMVILTYLKNKRMVSGSGSNFTEMMNDLQANYNKKFGFVG